MTRAPWTPPRWRPTTSRTWSSAPCARCTVQWPDGSTGSTTASTGAVPLTSWSCVPSGTRIWPGRVRAYAAVQRRTSGAAALPRLVHHGIAAACTPASASACGRRPLGLGALAGTGLGPRLDDSRPGRFLSRAVIGLIGDRLARERPTLASPMSLRRRRRRRGARPRGTGGGLPRGDGRLVVFLHGLCEDETAWDRHADRHGTTYAEALAGAGWSPLLLRVNTGLAAPRERRRVGRPARRPGRAWPVDGRRGSPSSATRWAG